MGFVLLFSILVRVDEVWLDGAAADALTERAARVVSLVLLLCGADVHGDGSMIVYHDSTFRIVSDCTGVEFVGLFTAAVLAFPSPWRARLAALAVGWPVLGVLNVVRMTTLIYVGAHFPSVLDYGHLYVWPAVLLATTLMMWLIWAGSVSRDSDLLV